MKKKIEGKTEGWSRELAEKMAEATERSVRESGASSAEKGDAGERVTLPDGTRSIGRSQPKGPPDVRDGREQGPMETLREKLENDPVNR